jgi:hypothetical protein
VAGSGFGVRGWGIERDGEFGFVSSKKVEAECARNGVFKALEGFSLGLIEFWWLRLAQ